MPRKRLDRELWNQRRLSVYNRDNGCCVHCGIEVTFEKFHTDHIKSGKTAGNKLEELRVLCRRCHVLRADYRHQGMIARALRDDIIPPNWRESVWED